MGVSFGLSNDVGLWMRGCELSSPPPAICLSGGIGYPPRDQKKNRGCLELFIRRFPRGVKDMNMGRDGKWFRVCARVLVCLHRKRYCRYRSSEKKARWLPPHFPKCVLPKTGEGGGKLSLVLESVHHGINFEAGVYDQG